MNWKPSSIREARSERSRCCEVKNYVENLDKGLGAALLVVLVLN
jgi:hypothetical protein